MNKMRIYLLIIIAILSGISAEAQYSNREVVPAGGGTSTGGTYSNFSVVAEPVVGYIPSGTYNGSSYGFLAPFGPTSSVISGGSTICNGSSSTFSVAISGGLSPYTVVYSDGTNNFNELAYTSGSNISVSPSSTKTYTLVSVTDASGIPSMGLSGSALVTVNPLPSAPTANDVNVEYNGVLHTATASLSGATIKYYTTEFGFTETTAPSLTNVGTASAWASSTISSCESATRTLVTVTITKKLLTMTADNKSKCQGSNNPTLTISYDGFVFGQNSSVLDVMPTISTTAVVGSAVGPYAISITGGSDNNYSFSYNAGTLTVTALPTPTITGLTTEVKDVDVVLSTQAGKSGYVWAVDGGTITSGNGTDQIAVRWSTIGSKIVTVSYDFNGCTGISGNYNVNVTESDITPPTYSAGTSSWNNTNQVVINWSEAVYTNPGAAGALTTSDFAVVFTKNGGTATGVNITGISHTAGSTLCTLAVSIVGTATGCEYFSIIPASATSIYDVLSNPATVTNETGNYNLPNTSEPTISASNIVFSNVTATTMTVSFTFGNGTEALIAMKSGSAISTFSPIDNTNYTVGDTYNDAKVIYIGVGNTVNLTDLTPNTTYYFNIYEANNFCGKINYKSNAPATNNSITLPAAQKLVITAINGVAVPNANGYVIVQSGTGFAVTVKGYTNSNILTTPITGETLTLSAIGTLIPNTISLTNTTTTMNATNNEVTFTNVLVANDDGNGGTFTLQVEDGIEGDNLADNSYLVYARAIEPTSAQQAKSMLFSDVQQTQLSPYWTSANSNNNNWGRILVMAQGATSLAVSQCPVDGIVYVTDNQNFSTSTNTIGTITPTAKTIYQTNGSLAVNAATITGLTKSTTYYFRLFEYRYQPGVPLSYNYRQTIGANLNVRSQPTANKIIAGAGVELAGFNAKSYEGIVGLNWETKYEKSVAGFELYRMNLNNEEDFTLISSYMNDNKLVAANKASIYTTTDKNNLVVGEEYAYKLTAVTYDGTRIDLAEQTITVLTMPNANTELFVEQISPNPVKNILNVNFEVSKESVVTIEVRDMSGKLIGTLANMQEFGAGRHSLQMNMNGKSAGSYILTIIAGMEGAMQTFIYMP